MDSPSKVRRRRHHHKEKTPNTDLQKYTREIFNHSDGICVCNGIIIECATDNFHKLLKYNSEELLGVSILSLINDMHKNMHAEHFKLKLPVISDKHNRVQLICKDSTKITVELNVNMIHDNKYLVIVKDLQRQLLIEEKKIEEILDRNLFATNMSHELRTPLNCIVGMNMLLTKDIDDIQDSIDSEKYYTMKESAEIVKNNCTLLLTQINDILDYAKLDSKKVILRKKTFSLSKIIQDCLIIQAANAQLNGTELIFNIADEIPDDLIGDFERLQQIIINLLGNGIRFTRNGAVRLEVYMMGNNGTKEDPEETNVTVSGEVHSVKKIKLLFKMSDSGLGIPGEMQNLLFASFSRLNNNNQNDRINNRVHGGTGLGLVICKKICNLMNGDIWLESSVYSEDETNKSRGSIFCFTTELEFREPRERTPSMEHKINSIKGATILIVDDEVANQHTYGQYVIEYGMIPILASSSTVALMNLKSGFKIDLAILDIKMPVMNGLELAKIMRRNYHVVFPIIALSSINLVNDQDGVFNHIMYKPVTKPKLIRYICKYLKQDYPNKICPGDSVRALSTKHPQDLSQDVNISKILTRRNSLHNIPQIPGIRKLSSSRHKYILASEDYKDGQIIIRRYLEQLGYNNYKIVSSGQEVIDELEKNPKRYTVVLLDIKMPDISGLEVAKYIIDKFGEDRPKLIALTAASNYGDEDYYTKNHKLDGYIAKPIHIDEFSSMLAKFL